MRGPAFAGGGVVSIADAEVGPRSCDAAFPDFEPREFSARIQSPKLPPVYPFSSALFCADKRAVCRSFAAFANPLAPA